MLGQDFRVKLVVVHYRPLNLRIHARELNSRLLRFRFQLPAR